MGTSPGILVESVEDYQSLSDLARCGRELWGLETVVMTHGPRATPGQIEAQPGVGGDRMP